MIKRLIFAVLLLPVLVGAQTKTVTNRVKINPYYNWGSLTENYSITTKGDTVGIELGGIRYKLLLTGGTPGMGLVLDNNNTYKPTNIGGGDTASQIPLNGLVNSNGDGSVSMSTYRMSLSAGTTAGNNPTWTFLGTSTTHTSYLMLLSTFNVASQTKPIGIFARGTTNGVEMNHLGAFSYTGTGTINANLWKGSTTIDKASQHASTAYVDQVNLFVAGQQVNSTSSTTPLSTVATGSSHGFSSSAASASAAAVIGYNSGTGYGVRGRSLNGYAGYFDNIIAGGNAIGIGLNGVTYADISHLGLTPSTAHNFFLGTSAKPLSQIHADSVFSGGIKVTSTLAGVAYFGANDTVYVSGLGTDTTYSVTVTLGSDPGQPLSYYAYLTQNGELYVVSKTASVENVKVYYQIVKRTY